MKIAKMFLTILLFTALCFPAFGASLDEWMLAEYLTQPQGRMATSGNSVLLEVYYQDNSNVRSDYAEAGVSGTFATVVLNLYEVGALGTATRFGGFDSSIPCNAITMKDLVDAINGDTSGYWTAKLGPDAYPSMPAWYMRLENVRDANVPESSVLDIRADNDSMKGISVGVQAEDNARVRLKRVSETTRGLTKGGTTGGLIHWIEVWDGDTQIWQESFLRGETCAIEDTSNLGVSPNLVNLTEDSAKGLGTQIGNGLCVVVRYPEDSFVHMGGTVGTQQDAATGSVSILYDVVKP